MDRQELLDSTIQKIRQLPDYKIQEVNDFADFLLSKVDDKLIQEGIKYLASESKTFDFLEDEQELYGKDDLKERYK